MKRLLLILLIPLLALVLISCDQDMRSGIAGFLGGFGGNAYLDGGLVPPDHTNAAEAVTQIAALGSGNKGSFKEDGKIDKDVFGLDEDLTVEDLGIESFLTPQDPNEQGKLKDNVETALGSDKEKQALADELKKPAEDDAKEAAAGTVALLDALLDSILDDDDGGDGPPDEVKEILKDLLPGLEDEKDLTQGDVLMLQLITDIVGNAARTLKDGFDGDDDELDMEAVMPVINDILFAAMVADELGGSMSLDFSGFSSLSALISGFLNEGDK
mgnify:CR=1 FL=1